MASPARLAGALSLAALLPLAVACSGSDSTATSGSSSSSTSTSSAAALGVDEATAGRVVPLAGSLNTRAIAGFRIADGRTIKPGILYRSSALTYLTDADKKVLADDLKVRTVIDFRGPKEQAKGPDQLPAGVRSIASPVNQDDLDYPRIDALLTAQGFSAQMHDHEKVDAHGPFYRMFTLVNSYGETSFLPKLAAYKTVFDQLLDPNRSGAILMHCTGGRDRTGIGTAILLRTLGVDEKTIEANYLASNTLLQPQRTDPASTFFDRFSFSSVYLQPAGNLEFQKVATELGETPQHIYDAVKLKASYLSTLWQTIDKQYGSFDAFLAKELGMTPDRITQLRNVMTA